MSEDTQVIASSKNSQTLSSVDNKVEVNTQTSKTSSDPVPLFDDTLTMLQPRVTRSGYFNQMREDVRNNNREKKSESDELEDHKKSLLKLEEEAHTKAGIKHASRTGKQPEVNICSIFRSPANSKLHSDISGENQHTPKSAFNDDMLREENFALSTPLAKMQLPESPDSATVSLSKDINSSDSPTSGAEMFRRLREVQNAPFEYDTELGIVLDRQEDDGEYGGEEDSTMDSGIKLNFNGAGSYKDILEDSDDEHEKSHDPSEKDKGAKLGTDHTNYSVVSEINDTTGGDFDQPILHGDLSMSMADDVQVPNSGNNTMTSPMKVDEKAQEEGKEAVKHNKHDLDFHGNDGHFSLPHDTQVVASQDGKPSKGEPGSLIDGEAKKYERVIVASSPRVTPNASQQPTQRIVGEGSISSTLPKERQSQTEQTLQSTEVISDSGCERLDNQEYPETLKIEESGDRTQMQQIKTQNENEKILSVIVSESNDVNLKNTLSISSSSSTQPINSDSRLATKQPETNPEASHNRKSNNRVNKNQMEASDGGNDTKADTNEEGHSKIESQQSTDSKMELQQDKSVNEEPHKRLDVKIESYIDSYTETSTSPLHKIRDKKSSNDSLGSVSHGIFREEECVQSFDIHSYKPFTSIFVNDGVNKNIFKIDRAWRQADDTAMFNVVNSSGSWEINQSCISAPAFLRIGDIVKYDGMKKYTFKITGLERSNFTRSSDYEITCCRGFDTAYIRRYKAKSSHKRRVHSTLLGRELKVGIDRLYLSGSLYKKYPYRIFDDESTFKSFVEDCLRRYGSEYKLKRTKLDKITDGECFKDCLFLMTMPTGSNDHLSDRQLAKVEQFLKENGATVISEFEKCISVSKCGRPGLGSYSMTLKTGIKKFKFAALLSTKQIRTLKYLQCLALGWPILSFGFIFDCIGNPEHRQRWKSFWMSYILPSGDSSYRNCTLSLNIYPFVENWKKGLGIESQLGLNADLFEGETILVDNTEKSSVDDMGLVFILKFLGFHRIFFLNEEFSYGSIVSVATKLRKYSTIGSTCCYFYSDRNIDFLPKLIESTNQRQPKGVSSSYLNDLPFLIINWEWLVQSLIAGFAFEPLKVWTFKEKDVAY